MFLSSNWNYSKAFNVLIGWVVRDKGYIILRHHLIAKSAAYYHRENMDSSVDPKSESGTMKRTEEKLRKNHEVEKGLGVQAQVEGDVEGASTNASTRSLAGSRVEGMTPGSLFEDGDTSGGYSQMPLPEVPGPSSGTAEREGDIGSAKTGKLGVEKSPHLRQIHMSGPPVTTGREYPLSLGEEKELGGTSSAGGLEENVASTHGHPMKGKATESGGAPMTSSGPHSTATVSHPSSAQTSPMTTSQEPPPRSTVPEGTTTSDTAPSKTMNPKAVDDEPLAHKTDAPPKKSKHGFFEKLKIKFEGKERPKGKN